MEQKRLKGKKYFYQTMVVLFMLLLHPIGVEGQIVLHDATDVTQTKATLSADFPDLSAEHGFQYKYGTLPELDDFSRLALAELSDPVLLTTTGNAWSARTVKGWVESKSGLSAGQSSVMSATVTFSEQTEMSFEWSVDSEDGIGVLSFIVDGTTMSSISGEVGFATVTYTASVGAHTFQWQYKKSAATNVGLDIGMVRNINFQNTTEGEWSINNSGNLVGLTPNNDYIYRAYQVSENNQTSYSIIKQFKTTPVTLSDVEIIVSQTTAKMKYAVENGDAQLTIGYLISKGTVPTDNLISALLGNNPTEIIPRFTGRWYTYGDNGVYCGSSTNVAGSLSSSLEIDIQTDTTRMISFDWAAESYHNLDFIFYVDGIQMRSLRASSSYEFQTVSITLSPGSHTLKWQSQSGSGWGSYYNMAGYIKNLDLHSDDISKVVTNNTEESVVQNLSPNTLYSVKVFVEGNNNFKSIDSGWLLIKTLNVKADTLSVADIRQASATIRGKIDGGDATIVTVGLQYKDAAGTRWTDYPQSLTDTLLSQTVTRLRPSTTYNYRSYIQAQDCDTFFSEIGTFTTFAVEARKPILIKRTQHTVELQGNVIFGDASIYQRGMQFRKAGSEEWEEVEDGGNDSIYTLKKTGLEMKADYQARTYIQPAGSDVIYSDILDFRTKNVEVYIDSITNIYQRNATVHGRIDCTDEPLSGGRISVYRVIDGQMSDLVKTVDIPTSDSLFVQKVTGLQPNTSYCFIAELDYGDGQKAYSNIHERDVTEVDAYKKALLASESSTDVEISYDEDWEVTDDGLYFGHYAWYDDLIATFTLTKTATISFDWSVVRSYAYTGSTSPDIKLFVDGSSTASKSIAATANNKTFSEHVTLTLKAGKHTLTWRPNYTGNFHVKNLLIPADATGGSSSESTVITTRNFFKSEGIIATDVTQTKALLIATLEETDENVEGYEFRYNVTDVLNLYQGENDERVVTIPTERGTNGNLSQQLSGLYPAQNYCYAAVTKIDGILFASPMNMFETLPVTARINVSSITQTSVTATVTMNAGDADVQNLQYYVSGTDMSDYQNVNGTISMSGLKPNSTYYISTKWTVSGKEYTCSSNFTTLATSVTGGAIETSQTTVVIRINPNYGTSTYVNSGFIFANDSVVIVPLGETVRLTELIPNTSYLVQPFMETVEGGKVYGKSITFRTKEISTATSPATSISNRSATMNGIIECDNYSSAEFGFQWKQMEGWNSDPAFTKGVKNEDGSISVALVNGMLEPNTDYQYRAAVRYKGQIYYANNWETFRTESEYVYYPANVFTIFRTDRENNCLILCGYYIAGSETVTSQGYEYWSNQSSARSYGLTSTPANNIVTITTDESMQYSLDMATLANGNYSVRAFVVTSSGIKTYGETLTFGVQNGIDAIENVEEERVSVSASGTTLTVHNATSLTCAIYSINGACITRRKLMSDEEKFDLNQHNVYIVRLSNGKNYKIHL